VRRRASFHALDERSDALDLRHDRRHRHGVAWSGDDPR